LGRDANDDDKDKGSSGTIPAAWSGESYAEGGLNDSESYRER
jgi:hypothetical protein